MSRPHLITSTAWKWNRYPVPNASKTCLWLQDLLPICPFGVERASIHELQITSHQSTAPLAGALQKIRSSFLCLLRIGWQGGYNHYTGVSKRDSSTLSTDLQIKFRESGFSSLVGLIGNGRPSGSLQSGVWRSRIFMQSDVA